MPLNFLSWQNLALYFSVTLEAREIPGEFEQVWYFEQLGIDGTHDDYYVLYLEEEISLIFACTLDKVGCKNKTLLHKYILVILHRRLVSLKTTVSTSRARQDTSRRTSLTWCSTMPVGNFFPCTNSHKRKQKIIIWFPPPVDELGLNFMDQPLNYDPDPAPCLYYQNNIAPWRAGKEQKLKILSIHPDCAKKNKHVKLKFPRLFLSSAYEARMPSIHPRRQQKTTPYSLHRVSRESHVQYMSKHFRLRAAALTIGKLTELEKRLEEEDYWRRSGSKKNVVISQKPGARIFPFLCFYSIVYIRKYTGGMYVE